MSSGELRNWLGATNMPLKEVLILDTCAAGAANEELLKLVEKRDVPPDQRRAVEFLKDATGTIILMGSAADKVSYEASKYGQGLLTYALLEGMKGRSIEEGSRLNVSHWFQNASEDVTQLAQSIGGVQKPVIAAPSGTGFPVALLDPADQARIPLAAVKPELLHLSCHDANDHDPLGLAAPVREQLREISRPSVRGQGTEPPVNNPRKLLIRLHSISAVKQVRGKDSVAFNYVPTDLGKNFVGLLPAIFRALSALPIEVNTANGFS